MPPVSLYGSLIGRIAPALRIVLPAMFSPTVFPLTVGSVVSIRFLSRKLRHDRGHTARVVEIVHMRAACRCQVAEVRCYAADLVRIP